MRSPLIFIVDPADNGMIVLFHLGQAVFKGEMVELSYTLHHHGIAHIKVFDDFFLLPRLVAKAKGCDKAGISKFQSLQSIDDIIAEGQKVSVRITFKGTFTGPLLNQSPTQKNISAAGIAIYKIVDGKIIEKWGDFNALNFLGIKASQ